MTFIFSYFCDYFPENLEMKCSLICHQSKKLSINRTDPLVVTTVREPMVIAGFTICTFIHESVTT